MILWTGLVDPATAQELQTQFAQSDRTVLWGIIGFGIILVLSIGGVGILLTHKVAGPLYKISSFFGRIRDNRLGPAPAKLRKGDELQDFYLVVPRHAPGDSRPRRGGRARARRGRSRRSRRRRRGARRACSAHSRSSGSCARSKEDSLEAPPIDRLTTSGS